MMVFVVVGFELAFLFFGKEKYLSLKPLPNSHAVTECYRGLFCNFHQIHNNGLPSGIEALSLFFLANWPGL